VQIDGACLCGEITYEADPDNVLIRHCSNCQVNSASAYGVVVGVTDGQFRLLTGTLKEYEKTADSGHKRQLSFCPECDTRIHARAKGNPKAFFGLRVGTIRQRASLEPKNQYWCNSALPPTSAFQSRIHISDDLLVLTKFNGKYLEAF
jgi:hypothetical protein